MKNPMRPVCSMVGGVIAGPVGALVAGLLSAGIEYLFPSDGVVQQTISDFTLESVRSLGRRLPSGLPAGINADVQRAFHAALGEALYDLGGKPCFPKAWRTLRSVPDPVPLFHQPEAARRWRTNDPLAQQACALLHLLVQQAEQQQLIPAELSPELEAAYHQAQTLKDLAHLFFEYSVLPILQQPAWADLRREWPDCEQHLRQHLFGRVLAHLNEYLTHDTESWRAFVRILLEGTRESLADLAREHQDLAQHLPDLVSRLEQMCNNPVALEQISLALADSLHALGLQMTTHMDRHLDDLTDLLTTQLEPLHDLLGRLEAGQQGIFAVVEEISDDVKALREWVKLSPVYRLPRIMGLAIIVLLFLFVSGAGVGVVIKYPIVHLLAAPMPEGWNIAVAGIGVVTSEGMVVSAEAGEDLSDQLYTALDSQADHIRGWRDIGFIVGDRAQRQEQAAKIAQQINADVVIYGTITPTTPGRARFEPEFYVAEESRTAAVYGSEILGPDQFGTAVEFSLGTDQHAANSAIAQRINALKIFLNGLQNYVAEDFVQARDDFERALEQTEPYDDKQVAAVIHLFLGALEQAAPVPDYDKALEHLTRSWLLWPEYARPYLSKGALLYHLALEQLDASTPPGESSIVDDTLSCFEPVEILELSPVAYLKLASQCYMEAIGAEGQTPVMEIEAKVSLGQGNIYLVLSDQTDENLWQEAAASFDHVIEIYETSDVAQQARIWRLAAHAHAKRGLVIICYPDCEQPEAKPHTEYHQAAEHYKMALELLQSPVGCRTDINRCYPGDVLFIESYRRQLDTINQYLNAGQDQALYQYR